MKPKPRDRNFLTVVGAIDDGSLAAMPNCGNIPLDVIMVAVETIVADFMLILKTADTHEQRCQFLDILLSIAHKAHILLQNCDPDIHEAAELLTDVTANLIGRLYQLLQLY